MKFLVQTTMPTMMKKMTTHNVSLAPTKINLSQGRLKIISIAINLSSNIFSCSKCKSRFYTRLKAYTHIVWTLVLLIFFFQKLGLHYTCSSKEAKILQETMSMFILHNNIKHKSYVQTIDAIIDTCCQHRHLMLCDVVLWGFV